MCVALSRALGVGDKRVSVCRQQCPTPRACVCSGALLHPEVGGPWEALGPGRKWAECKWSLSARHAEGRELGFRAPLWPPRLPRGPWPERPQQSVVWQWNLWGSGWPRAGLTAPRLSAFHGLNWDKVPRFVAAVRVRSTLLWKSKTPDPRGPSLSPSQWQSQ